MGGESFTSSRRESNDQTDTSRQTEKEEEWSPFKMNSVKNDFRGSSSREYTVEKSIFTTQWSAVSVTSSAHKILQESNPQASMEQPRNQNYSQELSAKSPKTTDSNVSDLDFDPLLSPHAYPRGTKSGPILNNKARSSSSTNQPHSNTKTIGVLIMDHGSKRSSSNQRLYHICEMYQSACPSNYVVKAAHMEIAQPSIPSQIEAFCSEGIKTIVCHPYFLSPGRHVLEDIPQIIDEAVDRLKREKGMEDLQVILTDPVGSKLDWMVKLIGSMVDDALGEINNQDNENDNGYSVYDSGFVDKTRYNDSSFKLGGFFGEIKRMMEEDDE